MTEKSLPNRCDELVTVVALCYNQSRFLRKTLDSIINQTWAPGHFYIIDDCSTDNSVSVINEWLAENNHPATLIVHETNQGITRTMNHALSLCKTKYFHPWPCDDILMPDKIESQVTYMESLDWKPGFLYGDIQWIDNDDNLLRESVVADRKKLFSDNKMPCGFIFPELVQHGCFIPTASGLYVTKVLKGLGGFDEELFAEDWDMFMRIALHSGIAYKEQVFSKYRRHNSSAEVSKGERYWKGHFKILPKYLGVNPNYDTIIWDKIGRDALQAARDGAKNSWRWLWQSALKTRNFKILYSYLRIKMRVAVGFVL
ncbi:glycosyltransferase [Alkalitalea saponilacus]|uniref:Glycosyltransferase involved in cell wall bisynthesis n=1 Tax=Alkalitalea saponilacus TaxID=889453 RepID=A0A1T5HSE2_9BACT|nr:glycosyltransferase [Alkalitalea saponilacus]ASB48309.1 hypothetical protein CDL62_03695 [Alkalitalea saponilacus]SKC23532.1 Glycosyltransferase involved in cell wall bisynthesis [Alkalitalea saponilacus]